MTLSTNEAFQSIVTDNKDSASPETYGPIDTSDLASVTVDSIQVALLQGGPVTLIYGILISSIVFGCIALTMAELASVYPTAGGQYHFVSVLAPEKVRRGMSYACGLLSIFAWIAIGASVGIIIAQQIMTLAIAVWGLLFNLFILKRALWTHDIGFTVTIVLFIVTFILTLVRSVPKAPSSFVWTTFINYTGWPDAICFITGLSTSCYMYAGLDASMHMAEECTTAARTVPKAIISPVMIGTVFIPVEVQMEGLHSTSLAFGLTVAGLFLGIFVIHAVIETTSRMTWSFARDNGLFASDYLSQIHPRLQIPVRSLLSSWVLLAICGCIYVASTTAFDALIGSSVVLQMMTFIIPTAPLLYRRRSEEYLPSNRPFAVPKPIGYTANIIVCCFGVVTIIFFNFPAFLPATGSSMNYTCAILGILLVLGLLNWFAHARRYYQGPIIEYST
ncbi:uncharacterized protein Z518_02322 [Rhinocladiella mackenziei CBS 650.93]|uniref:Amino acid transporter n=1 Tax=Rhinocladiella mackenziei CBS 650.93 TaxID=1442369 RepID=A0A0D2HB55_9EURO|nr:uncharacterized protein Z518_02322 [Rhinocladiella mackenziei CBS 650.93]KIX07668.1 hypothetical protein Z518_02322 [Rhinocladiella mackenziei CBS 650.93]